MGRQRRRFPRLDHAAQPGRTGRHLDVMMVVVVTELGRLQSVRQSDAVQHVAGTASATDHAAAMLSVIVPTEPRRVRREDVRLVGQRRIGNGHRCGQRDGHH